MKYLLIIIFTITALGCSNKKNLPSFEIRIWLQDGTNPDTLADIAFLKKYPFVTDVDFVSKKEAKEKYLADGNRDFAEIIETNPLPAGYYVTIDANKISKEEFKVYEADIKKNIPGCAYTGYPQK